MTFEYSAGQFHLRYFIDNIQRPGKEQKQEESPADTTSASNDTSAVKEDTKIYENCRRATGISGGKRSDDANGIANNVKYPAAAKKR
jgi:hypothetical protein